MQWQVDGGKGISVLDILLELGQALCRAELQVNRSISLVLAASSGR